MNSAVRVGRESVAPEQGTSVPRQPPPPTPGGVIKFQAPEVVFGPESLAEAGFAAWLSNRDIGRTLFIAETTAKFRVSNIMRKLDVGRRSEAVCVASQMGAI